MSDYNEEALEIASIFDSTNFSEDTQRQLKEVGTRPLPEDEEVELSGLIAEMGKVYGSAKVCIDGNENGDQCYNLEPELTDIMAKSTNFTLRTFIWQVRVSVCHSSKSHISTQCNCDLMTFLYCNVTDFGY